MPAVPTLSVRLIVAVPLLKVAVTEVPTKLIVDAVPIVLPSS